MKPFSKTLKLYHFTNRKLLSLSIMCSPSLVMTFFIKEDKFSRIRSEYQSENGYEDDEILVHQKSDYIRFTKFADGMEHNLRIEIGKWQSLLKNHYDLVETSTKELITVEVE